MANAQEGFPLYGQLKFRLFVFSSFLYCGLTIELFVRGRNDMIWRRKHMLVLLLLNSGEKDSSSSFTVVSRLFENVLQVVFGKHSIEPSAVKSCQLDRY